jgi:hypothetical protein
MEVNKMTKKEQQIRDEIISVRAEIKTKDELIRKIDETIKRISVSFKHR